MTNYATKSTVFWYVSAQVFSFSLLPRTRVPAVSSVNSIPWPSYLNPIFLSQETVANKVVNSAVFCAVDLKEVPDFTVEHKLYDPCTIMFFYKKKAVEIVTKNSIERCLDSLYPVTANSLVQMIEATKRRLVEREKK